MQNHIKGMFFNIVQALLLTIFMVTINGCTWNQLGQAVYDSAKSHQCMKETGVAFCDLNDPSN